MTQLMILQFRPSVGVGSEGTFFSTSNRGTISQSQQVREIWDALFLYSCGYLRRETSKLIWDTFLVFTHHVLSVSILLFLPYFLGVIVIESCQIEEAEVGPSAFDNAPAFGITLKFGKGENLQISFMAFSRTFTRF